MKILHRWLHLRSDADAWLRGVVRDASDAVDHTVANLRFEVEAFLAMAV